MKGMGQRMWGEAVGKQRVKDFRWCCVKPGVEFNSPCGFLPIRYVLWLYDSMKNPNPNHKPVCFLGNIYGPMIAEY